jgi:drug/metabolite transporter (DMT)-like permease
MNNIYVIHALLAAALFGASTPFAKLLVGEMSPWLLAGLLYLGSGLGLGAARLARDRGWTQSGLTKGEWPWLLGAIFFGGIVGPLALMFGLTRTSGSTASLLLNPGFDTSPRFSALFGKCLQRPRGFEGRDRRSAVVARL